MVQIDEFLGGIDILPPAPQILPLLLDSLAGADTHLSRVVDLIAFDPALTAKLLQTCNSAYFGRAEPVNDVFEAVNRIGFEKVFRIVAIVSGNCCLRPAGVAGVDGDRLWKHSVTAAFAAQFVGEDSGLESGPLFTAGLLHDLGKVVIALAPQPNDAQPSGLLAQADSFQEEDKDSGGVIHAELGARLLERWRFSPVLASGVRFHHQPWAAGDCSRHAACIALADELSRTLEGERLPETCLGSRSGQTPLEILGLAEGDLCRYRDRLTENVQFVEALCRA